MKVIPGFLVILAMGLLLLRIRKRYARGIVDSSTAYWELVDVFRNRHRTAPERTKRRQSLRRQGRWLEGFFLVLGVALVVLGVLGFAGLIPHTRNP